MPDNHPTETPPLPEPTATSRASSRPDRPATITAFHLNVRLLVWSIAAGGVLAVSLFFWHRFQVQRHALAVLDRARMLYGREDWNGAAAAFHRYLQLRPDDAEARLLRAQAFDKLAVRADQFPRAVALYFQAIRANPDRHETRLRLAELLFETRRYDEAAEQARRVVEAFSDDVKADRLFAAALREQLGPSKQVRVTEVVLAYQTGLSRHKGDIPLSVGLAEILRQKHEVLPDTLRETAVATADAAIEQMVALNAADPEAYLARFRYRSAHKIAGAAADLEKARQLAPDNVEVLLVSVISAAESDRGLARKYGERVQEVAPEDRRVYVILANLFTRWNQPDEAIRILRAGLKKIGVSDIDLNRSLLRLLLFVRNAEEARSTLKRIEPVAKRIGPYLPPPIRSRLAEDLEVARAEVQILDGKTALALPALKRLAANVAEGSNPAETLAERQRRWRLLGGAYSRLGLNDLAGAAYDELVRLDPGSQQDLLLAAAAWRQSGDMERAIRHLDSATLSKAANSAAWMSLAEARLEYQIQMVAAEARDWRGVEGTLKQARARLGDVPAVIFLQAMTAIARNNRQGALDELKKLVDDPHLETALLPRVAALLEDAGDGAQADAVLDRYRDAGGDPAVFRFTKSEILRRRGDAAGGIQLLEQALSQAPEDQRSAFVRRIISMEIDAGSMRSARKRLGELRKAKTGDLWVYEMAADLAITANDHDDLKDCEDELRAVEGETGSLWRYFRAVRLLEIEGDALEAARKATPLLAEIEARRPNWPQTRLLRGRIAQRLGHVAEAADNYEIALRSGSRNLTTLQWLVATLYKQNRFADAASYIRQVGQIASLSGELSSQAIPANLKAGRIEDALRIAHAAAELRPADPLAQVWYGQTLALADKAAEAEGALQKAIELGPKDIRTWTALVWFYSRQRRAADARKTLDDLVAQVDMTPFDRQLVQARGSDLIGDRQKTEQHYRDALAEHDKDTKLLEEVGRFYFRFDHDKALATFEQVLALDPKSVEARRAVALLWGVRGSEADWVRAIALLDRGDGTTTTDDRRLTATLLLVRGGAENARKAAALLNAILESPEQSRPSDRLLLARAYELLDQLDEAIAEFDKILQQNETPAFLVLSIEFLNRNKLYEAAGKALARLEEKDPQHPRLLELRVEWLNRTARAGEIEETVDRALAPRLEAAKKDDQKAPLLRYAADLFTRVKLYGAAEKKLRERVALVPSGNEDLAVWLAQRERYDEALALCLEKFSRADLSGEALALVRVLTLAAGRSESPPSPQSLAAQKVLDDSLASEKITVQLLLETGVLRVMQGRDADAVALYEQALKKEPNNPVLLNNLAVLLAEFPERAQEAVTLIDKAVAAVPNSLEVLDSKALVLMGAGRFAEARDILDRLCHSQPKNARYRLHLAMALLHLDESGRAREEAEQARKDGLEEELLTPSERRHLKEIVGDLATR